MIILAFMMRTTFRLDIPHKNSSGIETTHQFLIKQIRAQLTILNERNCILDFDFDFKRR